MRYLPYAVSLIAGLALTACSSASFSGTTPSRARSTPTDPLTGSSTGTATTEGTEPGDGPAGPNPDGGDDPSGEVDDGGDDSEVNPPISPENQPTSTDEATETNTSQVTSTSTSTSPVTPCADQTRSIGAKIAFLIDNSQSNELTDCPFPVKTGGRNSSGQPLYRCELETNREKAVLASFDFLQKIAEQEPNNSAAVSNVAITSFPTSELGGFMVQSTWRPTKSGERSALSTLLRFARQPEGQTPYGEAMAGAQNVFNGLAGDGRANMAILVTDGLPTDRNPSAVQAKADQLRQSGVRVVTVYVTGKVQRSQRYTEHRKLLSLFESLYQESNQHWYDTNAYGSFDTYMQSIFGLAAGMSNNEVVEVQDSAGLEKTLLSIISQEAIRCEP